MGQDASGPLLLAAGVALGAVIAYVSTQSRNSDVLVTVADARNGVERIAGPEGALEPAMGGADAGLVPVATRGTPPSYIQVGILTKRGDETDGQVNGAGPTILPLFGHPAYRGAQQWYYYCASDKFHLSKLPVERSGHGARSCSKEPGCAELQEGDVVRVPAYKAEFDFTRYNNGPVYEP